MTKIYKINGKEIPEVPNIDENSKYLNLLLEALSDKEEEKCNHIWSKSHIEPMFATCINCGKDRWLDKEEAIEVESKYSAQEKQEEDYSYLDNLEQISHCCKAKLFFKGAGNGLWCSSCKKEVFHTEFVEQPKEEICFNCGGTGIHTYSKESESTPCKTHDWINYDREPNNTPIDICRNCPVTRECKSWDTEDGQTNSCNLCEYLARDHSEESKRIAELNQKHNCGKEEMKQEECKRCVDRWNINLQHTCALGTPTGEIGTKQSTSLKDDWDNLDVPYLTTKEKDKVLKLIQSHLLKEVEQVEPTQYVKKDSELNQTYTQAKLDIIKIINNITK